jgi:hypothetical protein
MSHAYNGLIDVCNISHLLFDNDDIEVARQNAGLLWHTVVRPSVHASYDNISHLFPLLLIGDIHCIDKRGSK